MEYSVRKRFKFEIRYTFSVKFDLKYQPVLNKLEFQLTDNSASRSSMPRNYDFLRHCWIYVQKCQVHTTIRANFSNLNVCGEISVAFTSLEKKHNRFLLGDRRKNNSNLFLNSNSEFLKKKKKNVFPTNKKSQ